MATEAPVENAVGTYLRAIKDPSTLRDDERIAALEQQLADATDSLERLRLRQHLMDAQEPSIERYEKSFVDHAKAWADEHSISVQAFLAEDVPPAVLRRAGFDVPGGRGRGSARTPAPAARKRTRVTVDQVRDAIPSGAFTIKDLQDKSGASPAVVRKVVAEEESAGRLRKEGNAPGHRGPGRAPVLYRKA